MDSDTIMDEKLEQSPTITVENIIQIETIKTKRQHRRNSSLTMEISNRKQWLNSCYGRFKRFIIDLSKTTPYQNNFQQWLLKIENLNMMYLSIEITEDFQPVLKSIKNGESLEKTKYYIDLAMKRLCLHHDIDLDYISSHDYDRLCRYMELFCVSSVEDQ